ncbi:beta-propeller domain-containing protein [Ruminococcus sp.]|uniref:beta-propeller domain-containing protein n=1 Tax=Ruminococcus sp. TaxID=41978 RepID=UPI0025D7F34D|nr:beta-propeller domain-containing protein [Ruminococcus sp.]MBQ9542978.1 beta-propeller domain-containing protein [Ruminococcus sp.]
MRGRFFKRLAKENPLPDRIRPESIKGILDGNKAVIREVSMTSSEVKLNSTRKGLIMSAALAAAFVIAVGGLTITRLGKADIDEPQIISEPERPIADTTGLTGLRGGGYKSLHTFLTESDKNSWTFNLPQNSFVYNLEAQDRDISAEMRDFFENQCVYDGESDLMPVAEGYSGRRSRREENRLGIVKQENGKAFCARYCGVDGYVLNEGKAEKIEFEFLSDTFLMTELAENWCYPKEGTYLRPMVVGVVTMGDRLAVAYDFDLPEIINEKNAIHEYCGFCVYDVSDTENIRLEYEYEQPGNMQEFYLTDDGRLIMIGEYAEGKNAADYEMYNSGEPKFLPKVYENGNSFTIGEDSIYIANKSHSNILTVMSSFEIGESIENTDCILLTIAPTGIMVTDEHITLSAYYFSMNGEETESEVNQHLISVDTTDGLKVAAANYIDSPIDFQYSMAAYSEENGIRYIADRNAVLAVDDELNELGQYERTVYCDYSKEVDGDSMVGGFTVDDIAYANIVLLNGDTAYFCDWIECFSGGENLIVREIADMSDPASPKTKDVSLAPYSAPAVTGGYRWYTNYFRLDDKTVLHIVENYGAETEETKLQLLSLDPEKSVEATDNYYYPSEAKTSEEGFQYYEATPHEEYKLRKAGIIAEVSLGIPEEERYNISPADAEGSARILPPGSVTEDDSYYLAFTNEYPKLRDISGDGYIYLPMCVRTIVEKHEISEKEALSLPLDQTGNFGVEDDENGNTRYYYYDKITVIPSYLLVKYSEDGMEAVGEFRGESYECANMNEVGNSEDMGCVVYDGYIYSFSERGAEGVLIPNP